jgi:hypothetical protein
MMRVAAHGLAIDVPPGWEVRIQRRKIATFGEQAEPIVHLANFPLPEQRGDFGAGVVERMRDRDVFVVLFEYGAESVGQPLFRRQGFPRLTTRHFSPRRLQRTLPGQAGAQFFFTANGRAFCLYVVVAEAANTAYAVHDVNRVVHALEVGTK